MIRMCVDYLAVHYSCPSWTVAGAIADAFFKSANDPLNWEKISSNTKYGRVWDYGVSSAYGGRVLWNQAESGVIELCMVAKGQTLSRILDLANTLQFHREYISHCSRLDIALDRGVSADFRSALLTCLREGSVSGVRNYALHESGDSSERFLTLDIGSRDSSLFARLYDKMDSQGKFIRFEIETKRELASQALTALFENRLVDFYYAALARWSFFEEKTDKNLDRNYPLPEWLEFLAGAEKIVIEKPETLTTITVQVNWLNRQVSKTLAKLEKFYGAHFSNVLADILETGRSKLVQFDHLLVRAEKQFATAPF